MTVPFRRLTASFDLSGVGLHSGQGCSVRVSPRDGGLVLASEGREASIDVLDLVGTGRGSDYVFPDGSRIRTCEHVLAALTGLGVWGARLDVEGGEMPALDGCAWRMVEEIMARSEPCGEAPMPLRLYAPVIVGGGERFVATFPADELRITYVVRYDTPQIGTQMLDLPWSPEAFVEDVARARTFAMASDLEALRARGMALGGSLDNAILVGGGGVEAKGGLRWPDEFVRHKVLDLVGDMAALGRPLLAHVVAFRAGHELHLRLMDRLRSLVSDGARTTQGTRA